MNVGGLRYLKFDVACAAEKRVSADTYAVNLLVL